MNPLIISVALFLTTVTASFYSAGTTQAQKIVGIIGIAATIGLVLWSFFELGFLYGVLGIILSLFIYSSAKKSHME